MTRIGHRMMQVEAALLLVAAHVAVHALPFRITARAMGRQYREAPPASHPDASAIAQRVGQTVEQVALRLPMAPQCLAQTIAARQMLRRRGIDCTIYLGLRRMGAPVDLPVSQRPIAAHAWLNVSGVTVIGGDSSNCSTVNWFG
ncbi:MAG: lasso peptide biosynthesis B2 protein [Alphaproteobacteria bacterium]|nr:lasso peptide biosynthesis B2 protein [Alphaproteobacteria bacterium]